MREDFFLFHVNKKKITTERVTDEKKITKEKSFHFLPSNTPSLNSTSSQSVESIPRAAALATALLPTTTTVIFVVVDDDEGEGDESAAPSLRAPPSAAATASASSTIRSLGLLSSALARATRSAVPAGMAMGDEGEGDEEMSSVCIPLGSCLAISSTPAASQASRNSSGENGLLLSSLSPPPPPPPPQAIATFSSSVVGNKAADDSATTPMARRTARLSPASQSNATNEGE